jgi:uncharacterized protein (UPF0548 family)
MSIAADKPWWSFTQPSADEVWRFLQRQAGQAVEYTGVGATDYEAPPGFDVDHNRLLLGHGDEVFAEACVALRAWKMFPPPWTRILPENSPIEVGQLLAMQAQVLGAWWLNACRIVYVIDDAKGVARRFGFAYGTLPAHVEEGEERFSIELHDDGTVWYDLRAFSRPRYWPVRVGKPIARRLQRRFVRESQAAMYHAVARVTVP